MNRNTWKTGERRIATIFGTQRTPLSGGNSRHTRSDTLHKALFIEVKHRKKIPAEKLWIKTLDEAKAEDKTPLIVLIRKNHAEPLVLCKLSDIKRIGREIVVE